MERNQAAELDRVYVGFEVIAHLKLIASMEVAMRSASPALRNDLSNAITSMQQHLHDARELMQAL